MVNFGSTKGKRGASNTSYVCKGCVIIVACLFFLNAWLNAIPSSVYVPYHSYSSSSSSLADPNRPQTWDPYASFVPVGPATALPSIPIPVEEEAKLNRHIYGGKGDKVHLGGFTSFDPDGVSVNLWKHMISNIGIKSLLDLGCGKGTSTSWFVLHGLQYVVCAEGSHDAVTNSLLPKIQKEKIPASTEWEIVEHDFSRGPWWPLQTVDAVWCVEFTEHVGRNYQPNYLTAWRKAALIFFTHSYWGGWHHVEVHADEWWIKRMTAMGFVYSEVLTKEMRGKGMQNRELDVTNPRNASDTKSFLTGQHVNSLLAFINPHVASRPEHAHLFAEHGCYNGDLANPVDCATTTGVESQSPLPESYRALPLTEDMDKNWIHLMTENVWFEVA